MRGREIFSYYAFGCDYSVIKSTGLLDYDRDVAIDFLNGYFEFMDELDLQVTSIASSDLKGLLDELKASDVRVIGGGIADRIKAQVEKVDATLCAELRLRKAYVLTKKRYPLESLISDGHKELLAAGAWGTLTETSRRDFYFACVQVALSQPTASAFHLMRALEEQVKVLYFAFKKTNRLERPMWGPMTAELRNKRAPKPTSKLLDHLDGMRVHFRNPTQHPTAFYTLDEAQDLLSQTIAAINMISAELPRSK